MMNPDIETITKKEARNFIFNNKVQYSAPKYQLEGNNADVYELTDGRLLVYPFTVPHDENYPILIFKNDSILKKCNQTEYFPVDLKFQTLFEKEYKRMSEIELTIPYYKNFLIEYLKIHFGDPIENQELEIVYNSLVKMQKSKIGKKEDFLKALLAFSVLYMDYLRIKENGYWIKKKQYEIYNPICRLTLYAKGKIYDVYNSSLILFRGGNKENFDYFKLFVEPN